MICVASKWRSTRRNDACEGMLWVFCKLDAAPVDFLSVGCRPPELKTDGQLEEQRLDSL